MFQRNITDTTGLEPCALFNVVQFMTYDKKNCGVVTVDDTSTLRKERDGLYIVEEGALRPSENFKMLQGFTEESNANAIEMMVELVEVQRSYEAMHKAINAYRDMDSRVIRIAR